MLPALFCPSVAILECGFDRTAVAVFRPARRGRWQLCEYQAERWSRPGGGETDWLASTAGALGRLRERVQFSGPVGLVPPALQTLAKLIRVPPMAPTKRAKVLHFEAQENIPYPLAEMAWGSAVWRVDPAGCEVLLGAVKLDVIEPLCAAAESAGFTPTWVCPAQLATIAAGGLFAPVANPPILHVHAGSRAGILVLRDSDRMQIRTLSLADGGSTGAGALARPEARDGSKLLVSDEDQASAVEGAGMAFAEGLAAEIARSILNFQHGGAIRGPERILVTGEAVRHSGFCATLAGQLNLHVLCPDWSTLAGAGLECAMEEPPGGAAEISDLIGAAALRFRSATASVDLLPAGRRARREFRRRRPWLATAAGLAACALVVPVMRERELLGQVRRRVAQAERSLVPLRQSEARLTEQVRQLERVRIQLHALQRVGNARTGWLGLLADLEARLAAMQDVWLDRLEVLPPRPQVGSAPAGRLAVSGRMLEPDRSRPDESAPASGRLQEFLRTLAGSPYVASIEAERFGESQPGLLHFELVLRGRAGGPI